MFLVKFLKIVGFWIYRCKNKYYKGREVMSWGVELDVYLKCE